MQMTEQHFKAVLAELIDENPIACRGVLRLAEVVFTDEVPTLAVTLSGQPNMLVNLGFVSEHCHTETHVKAVIIHEFLHVLLNHTERFKEADDALNLALDAVINAIIHRVCGREYSEMMSLYYASSEGLTRMLRPIEKRETLRGHKSDPFLRIWEDVYKGRLVVDDILEIVRDLKDERLEPFPGGEGAFLGNHNPQPGDGKELSPEVERALRDTMRSMNGGGIWRSPKDRGVGANRYETIVTAKDEKMALWERTAWQALRECVMPDRRARASEVVELATRLPVLNERDRRGFLRSRWSPLVSEVVWTTYQKKPEGLTQVYLDVSGSMNAELESLVGLLNRLRRHIRMPFWAFSDEVAPAAIEKGQLKTQTSGGTSMNSVLRHMSGTRPGKALVVTDGYIESCDPKLLTAVSGQKILALISRDGSPAELKRAGIPYVQLERYPNDKNH